jgi:hypothetical protein
MDFFRVVEKERVVIEREREGEKRVGRGRGFRGTGKPRPTMEFTSSRGRGPLPPAFNRETVNNQGKQTNVYFNYCFGNGELHISIQPLCFMIPFPTRVIMKVNAMFTLALGFS